MRYDIFETRKSVHIKLTKDSHAALREKLFRYGITMQDLFQEAAYMVIVENERAEKLLRKISKKKMANEIEKLNRQNKFVLGELDSETLYNLLEESEPSNGTEEKE